MAVHRCAGCNRQLEAPGYCASCAARWRRELASNDEGSVDPRLIPGYSQQKLFRGHAAGYGRSCLPLLLLLVVSMWAVLAMTVTVVRAVAL